MTLRPAAIESLFTLPQEEEVMFHTLTHEEHGLYFEINSTNREKIFKNI